MRTIKSWTMPSRANAQNAHRLSRTGSPPRQGLAGPSWKYKLPPFRMCTPLPRRITVSYGLTAHPHVNVLRSLLILCTIRLVLVSDASSITALQVCVLRPTAKDPCQFDEGDATCFRVVPTADEPYSNYWTKSTQLSYVCETAVPNHHHCRAQVPALVH